MLKYAPVALQVLLLRLKLHESRTAIVSSTAAATLATGHIIVDKVVEEDHYLLPASERKLVSPRTE
jgi:hypothetical protein